MGHGSYLGGSTVIGQRSGWFSKGKQSKLGQPTNVDAQKDKNSTKKSIAKPAKSKKGNGHKVRLASPQSQGNGLTIPERISRAEGKFSKIGAEIKATERLLKKLREQLVSARAEIDAARKLPRRSQIGIALEKAKRSINT